MANILLEQQSAGGEVIFQTRNDIAAIFLGSSEERTVFLTEDRLRSLIRALREAARQSVKGLVLIGPHDQMFCAGWDMSVLASVSHSKEGEDLTRLGQEACGLLSSLPFTTVAALSGICYGAGAELALACNYRLITGLTNSRICFPDVRLGLIPSIGGLVRLPRLVGMEDALRILIDAPLIDAEEAYELGLVDQVIINKGVSPYAALKQAAAELALGRTKLPPTRKSFRQWFSSSTALGRKLATKRFLGVTPAASVAANRIIQTMKVSVGGGIDVGLKECVRVMGEMVVSPETKSLMYVYSLRENSKKLGRKLGEEARSAKVGVVGSNNAAVSIALFAVQSGNEALLVETNAQLREALKNALHRSLEKSLGVSAEVLDRGKRLLNVADKYEHLSGTDVIIEAGSENEENKKQILESISRHARRDAVIATTTSNSCVEPLFVGLDNPARFIGARFFTPVLDSSLVELIWTRQTSARTLSYVSSLISHWNRLPIVIDDTPGFLVSRLALAYFVEGCHLLSEGYAVSAIDGAAERFGMAQGPLRMMDEMGLESVVQLQDKLSQAFGSRFSENDIVSRLVSKGRKGRVNETGFYRYHHGERKVDPSLEDGLGIRKRNDTNGAIEKYLEDRLMLQIINEAVRIMDEGIAGAPGRDAAGQIDLGSVYGIGFPAWRGGVIHYGQSLGIDKLEEYLSSFAQNIGVRYQPCKGILDRASLGRSLYSSR